MAIEMIEGSFVALITPFNRDGSVDFEGFRTLLDFQEKNGTAAVLIMGSTGEVSMLSPEERRQIISQTAKMKTGAMKFFYGCTGNNTAGTIECVEYAGKEGADGAIIAVPAYICPPEEDAVNYVLEVCDASTIPVGFYNNPPRVKTDISPEGVLRMAEHPNMVLVKEATSRVGQIAKLAAAKPDMGIMCCDSPNLGLTISVMALGGQGTANMTGNILPRELATISKPWRNYDDAMACRAAWLKNLPMLHYTYSEINPVALKTVMRAVGLPSGDLRRPLTLLEGPRLQEGLDIIRDLGVAEAYGYKLPGTTRAAAE